MMQDDQPIDSAQHRTPPASPPTALPPFSTTIFKAVDRFDMKTSAADTKFAADAVSVKIEQPLEPPALAEIKPSEDASDVLVDAPEDAYARSGINQTRAERASAGGIKEEAGIEVVGAGISSDASIPPLKPSAPGSRVGSLASSNGKSSLGSIKREVAPPSFTPSPSPSPRASPRPEAVPVLLPPSKDEAGYSSETAISPPRPQSPKRERSYEDDAMSMERSPSHISASSSSDRKMKKSALSASPQLITHLPRAEKEAMTTFIELTTNDYHDKKLGKARGAFNDSMVCVCSFTPGVDDEILACSAYSGCINRATQIECVASECSCGKYCQNQRFQRRQYAPVEIVLTENKGYGVRAAADLKADSFLYEYVGEVMNEPTFMQRMQQYRVEGIRHFYFMMLQKGEYLDATKKGGKGRFINHSCNPNCIVAKWQVGKHMRMGIFARRDIAKGEELTFDYNVDRYGNDAQTCYCGEPNCVGTLGGKTQTDVSGIPELFIQALGISDQVEQMEARGTKKRKSKELDKDFVPILRPVQRDEVFKVMTGIRQANANQQILQKLLTRVEMTEDPGVQKLLVKLHGFTAIYGVLVDWKDDRSIIMLALSSLARWPLIAKNKVVDSGIEAQVIYLRDFYRERAIKKEKEAAAAKTEDGSESVEAKEDASVSSRAAQLLDAWDKLDMGYRIARKEADEAARDAVQGDTSLATYVDRRRLQELDEQPMNLEEAQAPNAVSEELGKALPEWTRKEMDTPMRQLPAVGRQPRALNGVSARGGTGGPLYLSPARVMNGGFVSHATGSPRTPDQMPPSMPSPFGKLGFSLKPATPAPSAQSIEDIIRLANEQEEQRRKEAEAAAKAARDAERLGGSSSSRKHARPASKTASVHSEKRRKASASGQSGDLIGSLPTSVGIDFNEDGSAATPSSATLSNEATPNDASARASGNEKKLRKMIGEIVVKQMSKHKDEFERDTFKKYAKELTNVVATKEMKNPKHWPPPGGVLGEFSFDKRTKIKAFCVEYVSKLLARKGQNGASKSRSAHLNGAGLAVDEDVTHRPEAVAAAAASSSSMSRVDPIPHHPGDRPT